MTEKPSSRVVEDRAARTIVVSREFSAPLPLVWRAYTESDLLDQWWGPAPWKAETKRMDFAVGGHWLYAMVGPNGERHWGRMNYVAIDHHRSIAIEDVFCDESGDVDTALPVTTGKMTFTPTSNGTLVEIKSQYASPEDLRKIVEMGYEQGISACLEQLARLLQSQGR